MPVTALISRPVLVHPRPVTSDVISMGGLCSQFMASKRALARMGELSERTIEQYAAATNMLLEFFGEARLVTSISLEDFTSFRWSFPATWGPSCLARAIQSCRTIFKFAHDSGLIAQRVTFGSDFRKPSRRIFRRLRNQKGSQMFEAEEIRTLIENAGERMRAAILLGINCGFGNADCGRLPISAIDLEGGWVSFPRPKTEIDRRCPLWPETVLSIKAVLANRVKRTNSPLLFVNRNGGQWCDGWKVTGFNREFQRLIDRVQLRKPGRAFYGLRRSLETIGGEVQDQVALDYIMGHVPHATDMAAVYRQRIADFRLVAVTDYVRSWLFPDNERNFYKRVQEQALAIQADWAQKPRLTHIDLEAMITRLKIKPFELARGVGLNGQWISALARGKAAISSLTELRIRTFIEQLCQGEAPHPIKVRNVVRKYDSPSEVPLTQDLRVILQRHPLQSDDLKQFSVALWAIGIPYAQLAIWWGYNYKQFGKFKSGSAPISFRGAERLRKLFGVPTVSMQINTDLPDNQLALCAPREVLDLIDREPFTHQEFRAITDWLMIERGFTCVRLSNFLGKNNCNVSLRRFCGRFKDVDDVREKLRTLLATRDSTAAPASPKADQNVCSYRLARAEQLMKEGDYESAGTKARIELHRLIISACERKRLTVRSGEKLAFAEALLSKGIIDLSMFRRIRRISEWGNRAAHGHALRAEQVAELIAGVLELSRILAT